MPLRSPRHSILFHVRAELLQCDLERLGRPGGHLDLDRIVLAQRIALPVLRHQQPSRIGVSVEDDAEEIPDFALEPVRSGPDTAYRRDVRVAAGDLDLDSHARSMRNRNQDVQELETGFARPEIDGDYVGQQLEPEVRVVAQLARDRHELVAQHQNRRVNVDARCGLDPNARHTSLDGCEEGGDVHLYASFCWAIFRWSWTIP